MLMSSTGLAHQLFVQRHQLLATDRLRRVGIESDRLAEDLLQHQMGLSTHVDVAASQGLDQPRQRRQTALHQLRHGVGLVVGLETFDDAMNLFLLQDLMHHRLGRGWSWRRGRLAGVDVVGGACIKPSSLKP